MATKSSEKLYNYLESLHHKAEDITQQLAHPDAAKNQKRFRELSKELAALRPLDEKYKEFRATLRQKQDVEELATLSEEEEMKTLALEEAAELEQKITGLEEETKILLVSDAAEDSRNAFLEIRAGAGGDEASLFAGDLLRMYTRVAEIKGWKSEVISTTYSSIGGIKEIIMHIRGQNVQKYIKFESGVHRVQRVPVTEHGGRVHTSTVTVAVMPEVDDVEVDVNMNDLRIDTYRSTGAGGQHVNRTESAIRITHIPTGLVVTCQDEKSQHKNKDKALKVLKSRLYEFEKERQDSDLADARRSQVGSGERSEKIRTYNFPQNRVTDHRISGQNFNIEVVLDGRMDDMVELLTDIHAKQLLEDKFRELLA